MPRFSTTRRVRHPAEAMFALVADVERYPEFVPFCENLIVLERTSEGEREVIVAAMSVGYKMIRETFTSRVSADRSTLTIRSDLIDGPFRSMRNVWEFRPVDEGSCDVSFAIDYEFRSRMLAALMGAMFDRVFRTFAGAFEKRADALYPRRG